MSDGPVRVRILGDVEVVGPDGASIALTPLPAAVLCRLMVAAGARVTSEVLLADLWADRPATDTGTVRVTVTRLRKSLEAAGLAERLATRSSGWSLTIDRSETDLGAAAELLDQAVEARRRGNVRVARVAAVDASGMLSAPPLANVPGLNCFAELCDEIAQLASRADAEIVECELALGNGADVVARCLTRAGLDVLDEAAVSRAVRALVQAGRHADAVTWCHRHSDALAERGLVPSDPFRALELAVLHHGDDRAGVGRDRSRGDADGIFVGRLDETDRLIDAMESASAGPHLLVVDGAAGIGKTRLVREFCATKVPLTRRVLYGACSPERAIPFEPFVEALSTSSRTEWTRLLERAELAEDPLVRTLSISDAVTRALRDALQSGGVLVIDDAHWIDAASVSVLRMLLRSVSAPVLVILVVRTPDERANPSLTTALGELVDQTRLTVRGLDDDDTAALFGLLAGRGSGVPGVDGLGVLSRGNPLLVRTLARAASEMITGEGLAADGVLRAAFASRFARLGAAATSTLAAAAVLGQRFGLRRLAHVADIDIGAALDAVEHAVALDLLLSTDRFDEYVFDHDLLRHEALSQVSPARLALFHARAAEALLAERGADAQVVRHLVDAGSLTDPSHLAAVAAEAAVAAMDTGALDLARDLHEIGMRVCLPRTAADATLLAVHGAVMGADGRVADALAALDQAFELCTDLGLDRLLAQVMAWQSGVGRVAVSDEALDRIRALCDRLRVSGDLSSLGTALTTLSLCLRLGPHRDEARSVAAELSDIASILGTAKARHGACSAEHHMHFVDCAPVERRRRSTRTMRELAIESGDRFAQLHAHRTDMNDLLAEGAVSQARLAYDRMKAIASDRTYPLAAFLTAAIDIGLRIVADDLDRIDEAIEAEAALGRAQLVAPTEVTVAAHLFAVRWAQGRLAELVDLLGVVSVGSDVVAWKHAHVLTLVAAGRVDEARSLFADAIERTITEPVREWLWLPEALMAAEACAAVGTVDHCARLIDVLEPYADLDVVVSEGNVLTLGPLSRPLAVLLHRVGRADDARRWAAHAAVRTGPDGARLWARVGVRLDPHDVSGSSG